MLAFLTMLLTAYYCFPKLTFISPNNLTDFLIHI